MCCASRLFMLLCLAVVSACSDSAPPDEQDMPGLAGLRVSTVLGGERDDQYAHADRLRDFRFPADHDAHPGFRSEWWYITAVLEDDDGREYGVQFTLFRQAFTPRATGPGPWHTGVAYLGHLAVSDVASQQHHQARRFSRGHPQLAGVTVQPRFRAWIEDWLLTSAPGDDFAMNLQAAAADGFAVALDMRQTLPVILQGEGGLSRKGPGSGSYYYSMPRLAVSGRLQIGEATVDVQGLAWMDREWSTSSLSAGVEGWDWFALQLDDGRSIMAFRLRTEDGTRNPFDHGMLIEAGVAGADFNAQRTSLDAGDAGVTGLHPGNFELTPSRYWQDNRGARWPVGWTLRLGGEGLAEELFVIETPLDDQLMDGALVYWEGIVAVRDSAGRRSGRGYMELTGYEAADKAD